MLGLYVSVPIACFRKGLAREYLETEPLPPPSTCYGFLLSLIGETHRTRHIGCRVTAAVIGRPELSVVLRTVWRVKKTPLGSPGNMRPDYQQLLTGIELIIWLDSTGEANGVPNLEERVAEALDPTRRGRINRFGGLSLGESTHMVNEVRRLDGNQIDVGQNSTAAVFLIAEKGRMTLPVWVDHVGSAGTRYVTGNLVEGTIVAPELKDIPVIQPK